MSINQELDKIFQTDKKIDEIDIIDESVLHFYAKEGKYDYLSEKFILMEHKLGISSKCIVEIVRSNK